MALRSDDRSKEVIEWANQNLVEEEWKSEQHLYRTLKRIIDQKKQDNEQAKESEPANKDDASLEETLKEAAENEDSDKFITVSGPWL